MNHAVMAGFTIDLLISEAFEGQQVSLFEFVNHCKYSVFFF